MMMRAHLSRQAWRQMNIGVWLYQTIQDKAFHVAPISASLLAPVDTHLAVEPTFEIDAEAAQNMIDELWRVGVRPSPSALTPEDGRATAQAEHLQDMRAIAFSKLGVEKP